MSVTPLKASAATIVALRNRLSNQERLDNPISETNAWTLFQDATVRIDTRRLAAHRLLDIAIELQDAKRVHQVVALLHKGAGNVRCFGLLQRIKRQKLDVGWQTWAFGQLKKLAKVATAPETALAA